MSAGAPVLPGLERNAVVAASAGTGKTQLLTGVYLARALGLAADGVRVPPARIGATTFSRAAAREIRERLELRLAVLAGETTRIPGTTADDTLFALARGRGLALDELALRARQVSAELPQSLIDTMHGLAARLLRDHAPELGLSPDFSVLEEHESIEEADEVIEQTLWAALEHGEDSRHAALWLLEIGHGLEPARAELYRLISLLDEEGADADELALSDHGADARTLRDALRSAAEAALATDAAPARRAPAELVLAATRTALGVEGSESTLAAGIEALLAGGAKKLGREVGGAALRSALEALPGQGSQAERMRDAARFVAAAPRLPAMEASLARLVGGIQRTLRERRRVRGALGFGELLRLARDGLLAHPTVAARAAAECDLLLVDEFQDTSRVQRDLLLLLRQDPAQARRRVSGQMPSSDTLAPRGLLVVGDRKQSIYGFRGADVSIYAELAAELAGAPAAAALELSGVRTNPRPVADFLALKDNYRSGRSILRFVNAVARRDFAGEARASFEIRYADAEWLEPALELEGRVTLLEDDGSTPEGADELARGARKTLRTALVVAGFCARAKSEGTPLRDIAVLARRRSTLPLLELALDRLGIPFVVAGRALYAMPEVRDFAALLRTLLDPYDRRALSVVARSPLGGLAEPTLALLSRSRAGLLPAAEWAPDDVQDPDQQQLTRELRERLLELAAVAPRLSARDALAAALELFEAPQLLVGLPRGAGRLGNVTRLLEIAGRRGGNLPAFVRWLERQIALDVDESEAAVFSEEDEAVRLLTIHASKGLAFSTTIVVDVGASERARSTPFSLLRTSVERRELVVRHQTESGALETPVLDRLRADSTARARAERQRLSYVAMTRAQKELVLALPAEKPAPDSLGASVLAALGDPTLGSDPGLRRLPARELLRERFPAAKARLEPGPALIKPERPAWRTLAAGVTALADFAICARRFELLHVVGLDEPGASLGTAGSAALGGDARGGDEARALGSAAHRVLERFPLERWGGEVALEELLEALEREGLDPSAPETRLTGEGIQRFLRGSYARELRFGGALRIEREVELTVALDGPAEAGQQRRQLELFETAQPPQRIVLRATLDLLVERQDASLDVLDYKRTRGGDAERYGFQLAAYRSAVEARYGARRIRTGLVHLLAESGEPDWVTPPPFDPARLGQALAEARHSSVYAPVGAERCRAARCGFLAACHPAGRS